MEITPKEKVRRIWQLLYHIKYAYYGLITDVDLFRIAEKHFDAKTFKGDTNVVVGVSLAEILGFVRFKGLYLYLRHDTFWPGMKRIEVWIDNIGYNWAAGVFSERRLSSCSS